MVTTRNIIRSIKAKGKMWQIYRKIPKMTESELIFWRDYFMDFEGNSNCDWPAKIVNACILKLEGYPLPHPTEKSFQTGVVEMKWKAQT